MAEFLKALFGEGESLTYDQLVEKMAASKINAVNLTDGGYVSMDKFNGRVNTLTQQVQDLQGQIAQRDTDLSEVRAQLTTAQADAGKLPGVQQTLEQLQSKYETDRNDYEQRLAQQSYEFAIRERANGLHFSSGAAKREFIRDAISKKFKQDGDTLQGYDEFVAQYRASDPTAFVADASSEKKKEEATQGEEKPKASFVRPGNTPDPQAGNGGFNFTFAPIRMSHDE